MTVGSVFLQEDKAISQFHILNETLTGRWLGHSKLLPYPLHNPTPFSSL
jgi:hypothetical protein